MSSVLNTSTMKSPPLVVCVTGSFTGGWVSTAICRGPGTAALRLLPGAAGSASAAAGVSAAALASVAPLRKLRRPMAGEFARDSGRSRFGIGVSSRVLSLAPTRTAAGARLVLSGESRAASVDRQGGRDPEDAPQQTRMLGSRADVR